MNVCKRNYAISEICESVSRKTERKEEKGRGERVLDNDDINGRTKKC